MVPGRKPLVTLRDAALYITKLPKSEHDAEEWQAAMKALMLVAEHDGPTMFARIGMMRALNRRVERGSTHRATITIGTPEAGAGSMMEARNYRGIDADGVAQTPPLRVAHAFHRNDITSDHRPSCRHDPDLMDMKLWSEVPQPIRKIGGPLASPEKSSAAFSSLRRGRRTRDRF
jgi:hypothetical protein